MSRDDEHVLRIDATTPQNHRPSEDLSELPQFPVLFGDALWLIGYGRTKPHVVAPGLDHADPADGDSVLASPAIPDDLSGGSRALWTVGPDSGYLWRIDPPTELAKRGSSGRAHPISVAVGEGAVWVGTQEEKLR